MVMYKADAELKDSFHKAFDGAYTRTRFKEDFNGKLKICGRTPTTERTDETLTVNGRFCVAYDGSVNVEVSYMVGSWKGQSFDMPFRRYADETTVMRLMAIILAHLEGFAI